jgi:hypothetical protein
MLSLCLSISQKRRIQSMRNPDQDIIRFFESYGTDNILGKAKSGHKQDYNSKLYSEEVQ